MTQDFVAQSDSNFTAIRYYTQFDPYFYSVDNRPLQDIELNLKDIRSGGADSARRATLLSALGQSMLQKYLVSSGVSRFVTGLEVSTPSTNTIRVAQGAVFETKSISPSLTDTVVKQAFKLANSDFSFTPPATPGQSQVFTIEGKFQELTSANMGTSTLPYLDATNQYLASTLIHGELLLQANTASIAATSGTEVPPATTSGWFPLYNITYTQGVTNPVVAAHSNAPGIKGVLNTPRLTPHTTNGATQSIIQDALAFTFADAASSNLVMSLSLSSEAINPFRPIKLKISAAPSAANGNWAIRLNYKGLTSGDLITTARTASTIEAVAVTAAVDTLQSFTTSTAVIPNTEFSGFSNGSWGITKDRLVIVLERVGADAADTNTGSMNLFKVELIQ